MTNFIFTLYGSFLYKAIRELLRSCFWFTRDIEENVSIVLGALEEFFSNGTVNSILNIFIGFGGSLVVIYFIISLTRKASLNQLTPEIFVSELIKVVLAVVILMILNDIIVYAFQITDAIYKAIADSSSTNSGAEISFFGWKPSDGDSTFPEFKKGSDVYTALKEATTHGGFGLILSAGASFAISKLALYSAMATVIGSSLLLIVRIIFAPIGIAQLFEDGTRSAGLAYLKRIIGNMLIFAGIAGVLYAREILFSSLISKRIADSGYSVINDTDSLEAAFFGSGSLSLTAIIIILNIATLGAIAGVMKVTSDVVGG